MQFMCYRAGLWFTVIEDASLRHAPVSLWITITTEIAELVSDYTKPSRSLVWAFLWLTKLLLSEIGWYRDATRRQNWEDGCSTRANIHWRKMHAVWAHQESWDFQAERGSFTPPARYTHIHNHEYKDQMPPQRFLLPHTGTSIDASGLMRIKEY